VIEYRDGNWKLVSTNPAGRLLDRLPAFVPDWSPTDTGPGRALLEIAERFTAILAERLVKAPDKAKLVFLDDLGVEPIPPQPARAPVVFELMPGATHARAPERTQLLAQAQDGGPNLTFETESEIGLAASRLVEVKASLTGNRFVDHSQDVTGEKPFILFASPQSIPRELYLAHDRLFAVTPESVVELQVELAPTAAKSEAGPPNLRWEYFDGRDWSPFAPFPPTKGPSPSTPAPQQETMPPPDTGEYSDDGTQGLSRSGTIKLRVSNKPADQTTIRGIKSYWIHARVTPDGSNQPAPPRSTTGITPLLIDRFKLQGVSKVGGFRLHHPGIETLIDTRGGATRKIRVRLTDDSGTPLALTDGTNSLTIADLNDPGNVFTLGTSQNELDTFVLETTTAKAIRIRVSLGKVDSQRRLNGAPVRSWDLSPIDVPRLDRSYDLELARGGRLPTMAFANGVAADPTAPFQPFGPQPQPGATLLFACPEVLTKPGAKVTIFTDAAINNPAENPLNPTPTVRWEYWNGMVWAPLPDLTASSPEVQSFCKPGEIQFIVPQNLALKTVLGQEQLWVRVMLAKDGYLIPQSGQAKAGTKTVFFDKVFPPVVKMFRLGYEYISPAEPARACVSRHDFRWSDNTTAAAFGGNPFEPFPAADDLRPALYLGFTRALPSYLISLFINVHRTVGEPDLSWEYHDGNGWRRLTLKREDTKGLSQPGLVQFVWPGTSLNDPEPVTKAEGNTITFLDARVAARFRPGDPVAVFDGDDAEAGTVQSIQGGSLTLDAPLEKKFTTSAVAGPSPLPRFGTPRHWVRVVWPRADVPQPGDPDAVNVAGIYLNAVWAEQAKSVANEIVGSTTGVAGETFDLANRPVLAGEKVEVLELDGFLAEAGQFALRQELQNAGQAETDLSLERDEKTGKAIRAWVTWQGRPNFAGSGPDDRHYVLERIRGSLQFGDGRAGRVPPVNPNNVRVSYRTGGGKRGNLPERTLNVVLGSVTAAQVVFNPIPAGGGADAEMTSLADKPASILERGPQLIRHRHRALTAADYEQLARSASPGVAVARVVTPASSGCIVPAGSVQVVILPHSDAQVPEPAPSPQLLAYVTAFIQSRAHYGVAGGLTAIGPTYFHVGVDVTLVPASAELARLLSRDAKRSIAQFLHPVVGGPEGRGWGFGQAVYPSDLVKWLHQDLKENLAYVQDLRLLSAGDAVPEQLDIPPDQVPCAGPIRVIVLTDLEVNR